MSTKYIDLDWVEELIEAARSIDTWHAIATDLSETGGEEDAAERMLDAVDWLGTVLKQKPIGAPLVEWVQ